MKFLTSQIYALKSREDFVYFAETVKYHETVIESLNDYGKDVPESGELEEHEKQIAELIKKHKDRINSFNSKQKKVFTEGINQIDDEYDKLAKNDQDKYKKELKNLSSKLSKLSDSIPKESTTTEISSLEKQKKDAEDKIYKSAMTALKKTVNEDGGFDQEEEGFDYVHLSNWSDDVEMDMAGEMTDTEIFEEDGWGDAIEDLGMIEEEEVQEDVLKKVNRRIFAERAKISGSREAKTLDFIKKLIEKKQIKESDKQFNLGFAEYFPFLEGDLEQDVNGDNDTSNDSDWFDKIIISTTENDDFVKSWEDFNTAEKEFIRDYLNDQKDIKKVIPLKTPPKKAVKEKPKKTKTSDTKKTSIKKDDKAPESKEVSKNFKEYKVKKGEILSRIIKANGVNYSDVYRKGADGEFIAMTESPNDINLIYAEETLYIDTKNTLKRSKPLFNKRPINKSVIRPINKPVNYNTKKNISTVIPTKTLDPNGYKFAVTSRNSVTLRPISERTYTAAEVADLPEAVLVGEGREQLIGSAQANISESQLKKGATEAHQFSSNIGGKDTKVYGERVVGNKVLLDAFSNFTLGLGKGYEDITVVGVITNGANSYKDLGENGFMVSVVKKNARTNKAKTYQVPVKLKDFNYEHIGGSDLAKTEENPFVKYMTTATQKGMTQKQAFKNLLLKNSNYVQGQLAMVNLQSDKLADSDANMDDFYNGEKTKGTFVIEYLNKVAGLTMTELKDIVGDEIEIYESPDDPNLVEFGFDWEGVRYRENVLQFHRESDGSFTMTMTDVLGSDLTLEKQKLLDAKFKELDKANGITSHISGADIDSAKKLLNSETAKIKLTPANIRVVLKAAREQNKIYHEYKAKLDSYEEKISDY